MKKSTIRRAETAECGLSQTELHILSQNLPNRVISISNRLSSEKFIA